MLLETTRTSRGAYNGAWMDYCQRTLGTAGFQRIDFMHSVMTANFMFEILAVAIGQGARKIAWNFRKFNSSRLHCPRDARFRNVIRGDSSE